MIAQHVIAAVLLLTGVFFLFVAAVGFARLPDVFCRLHVTGVVDTLGAPLVLLAAAVYLGASLVTVKLLLGILFLAATSPLVGHLLARAALEAGHEPGVIEAPRTQISRVKAGRTVKSASSPVRASDDVGTPRPEE
jgi:multicomponent Na+:H+ antiporter subunit G